MANTINEESLAVGMLVYPYAKPVQVSKVVSWTVDEIDGGPQYNGYVFKKYHVTIRNAKGKESTHESWTLRDFDALIAEHEKKIETLRGYKAKLNAAP